MKIALVALVAACALPSSILGPGRNPSRTNSAIFRRGTWRLGESIAWSTWNMMPDVELSRLRAALELAELLQGLSVQILGILNQELPSTESIQRIVAAIRTALGFDAVGIRLRLGEGFPYYAQQGFEPEFLLAENTLLARNLAGDVCRDEQGRPVLECICGVVLSGNTDATSSTITANGSFWMTHGADSPGFPGALPGRLVGARNRCLDCGVRTMALIPIRANHEIIGLLQLSDRIEARLNAKTLQALEGLCCGIGLALARRQTEEALRRLEARQRAMISNISDVIAVVDQDGKVRYKSDNVERWFGWLPSEVIGNSAIANIHPGDLDIVQHVFGSLMNEPGTTVTGECRYRCKDGCYKWIEISATNLLENPHINGILLNYRDISDRKQKDERLRLLSATIDVVSDSIYWIDREGRLIYVNPAGCGKVGYSQEELSKMYVFDVNPRVTPERWRTLWQLHRETLVFTSVTVNRDRAGREFPVEIASAYVALDGREYIAGFARDITDRQQAEDALQMSEKRYRLLFMNMTEGFALHEMVRDELGNATDYRYLDVNPAFERITGIAASDAIGKTARQLFQDLDPERLALRERVVCSGEPHEERGYDRVRNRHFRAVLFRPQPEQFATLYEDTTEREQAVQALREKNAELERFINAVSHDLKSPLITIQTFLTYLDQDVARGELVDVPRHIGFIRNASTKMQQLLEELLRLSRVGRDASPPEEMTLVDVVHEALSLVAGRFAQRSIAVKVTSEPVVLTGDRRRLVELFQNLLDNAAKFIGEQPEPLVQVGVETVCGELALCVRDNGIGFESRHRDRLFDPFSRLNADAEGSGMGLALVKRIVQLHGGRVWAESDGLGLGAIFKFTLARAGHVREWNESHESEIAT